VTPEDDDETLEVKYATSRPVTCTGTP